MQIQKLGVPSRQVRFATTQTAINKKAIRKNSAKTAECSSPMPKVLVCHQETVEEGNLFIDIKEIA